MKYEVGPGSAICALLLIGFASMTESLAVIILVGGIVVGFFVYMTIAAIKSENAEKEKKAAMEFYQECEKHGITNLKDTYQREKATLIAQRLGCKYTNIEQLYEETCAAKAREKQNQELTELRKLREAEEAQKQELKRFADYKGRNKRIATLEYMQAAYRKKAEDMRKGTSALYHSVQEREINSSAAGGFASGLAGGAAGIAAYLDAENENAKIRARNRANLDAISPVMMFGHHSAFEYDREADKLQASLDDAKIKLVSPKPDKEVFDYLSVAAKKVEISKTGAFLIEAEVKVNAKKQNLMIGKADGVIDGTIVAEMYQNGQHIGSALMMLPTFGVKNSATVMGLSTCHADSTKPYEMKFRPYHLWIMEE